MKLNNLHGIHFWVRSGVIFALLALSSTFSWADANKLESLARLKTAYLFNIAKFVEWPGQQTTVRLCVQSSSQMSSYLVQLDGRKIDERRFLQVVLQEQITDGCSIFYGDNPQVSADAHTDASKLIEVSQGPQAPHRNPLHVLTASDHALALDYGYAVRFHIQNGKLRFQFSESALQGASYKVSSKLLVLSSGAAG